MSGVPLLQGDDNYLGASDFAGPNPSDVGNAGGVQRVFKGMRMAGRMGGEKVTIKNLEVVEVDAEKNILALKGAVPGKRGAIILISQK